MYTEDVELPKDYNPYDDESFMGPRHLAYFKRKLVQLRNDIDRETRETLMSLRQMTFNHPDQCDQASLESHWAVELETRTRQRRYVDMINSALDRIEDGTYGYCEATGEPISIERLEARPVATLSLAEQEKRERRERLYRKER